MILEIKSFFLTFSSKRFLVICLKNEGEFKFMQLLSAGLVEKVCACTRSSSSKDVLLEVEIEMCVHGKRAWCEDKKGGQSKAISMHGTFLFYSFSLICIM